MYNNQIKLVEELTQEQLDTLKNLVFWDNDKYADFTNLTEEEQEQVKNALFDNDISNTIIYKLYRDIYFTNNIMQKLKGEMI